MMRCAVGARRFTTTTTRRDASVVVWKRGSSSSTSNAKKQPFSSSSSSNTSTTKTKCTDSNTTSHAQTVATQHGVRLTPSEQNRLQAQLLQQQQQQHTTPNKNNNQRFLQVRLQRELCLTSIEQPTSRSEKMATQLLTILDYSGTALFAVVGTQLAGEKEMNLIGCTLVGCIAAMGGGTLNNLLYGSNALLLSPLQGVFWVRLPSYLTVSIVASVLTFYCWPYCCRQVAKQELQDSIGKEHLNRIDGSVSKGAFVQACVDNPAFAKRVAAAFDLDPSTATPEQLFAAADPKQHGRLSLSEMETLVAKQFDHSVVMYGLDTLALSAFAAVAVNGAVQRGLHPLVAATSGVTVCFGGILRDVLCGRDLAIGGQSYAFATGAGATVYVILRELRLKGLPLPFLLRIVCCFGTTMGLRVWEYLRPGQPLLRPMHHYARDSPLRVMQRQSTVEWLDNIDRKD